MSNKRKAPRQQCLVPIDGKIGSPFDQSQTVDVSKTGLGLVLPKKVPVNKKIAVELDFEKEGNPVFVIGKVKWVRAFENGRRQYRVGLAFDDVLEGSKVRLKSYFKKDKKEKSG